MGVWIEFFDKSDANHPSMRKGSRVEVNPRMLLQDIREVGKNLGRERGFPHFWITEGPCVNETHVIGGKIACKPERKLTWRSS